MEKETIAKEKKQKESEHKARESRQRIVLSIHNNLISRCSPSFSHQNLCNIFSSYLFIIITARLQRALEELDKYKDSIQLQQQQGQPALLSSPGNSQQLELENKKLKKQNNDLTQGFELQMKLIDLLKRQKVMFGFLYLSISLPIYLSMSVI